MAPIQQITRKQKEQLEYILAHNAGGGPLPPDLVKDDKIIELFGALTDENGSM